MKNQSSANKGRRIKEEVHHAEIIKTTPAELKQQFHVRYIGENGKTLSASENVSSRGNCHKNIIGHIKLAHGTHMQVHDLSGKKVKKYILYVSGLTKPIE